MEAQAFALPLGARRDGLWSMCLTVAWATKQTAEAAQPPVDCHQTRNPKTFIQPQRVLASGWTGVGVGVLALGHAGHISRRRALDLNTTTATRAPLWFFC